jgi:hypothetical protein
VQTFAILPRPFGHFRILQLFTVGNDPPRLESPAKRRFAPFRLGAGPNNSDEKGNASGFPPAPLKPSAMIDLRSMAPKQWCSNKAEPEQQQ